MHFQELIFHGPPGLTFHAVTASSAGENKVKQTFFLALQVSGLLSVGIDEILERTSGAFNKDCPASCCKWQSLLLFVDNHLY